MRVLALLPHYDHTSPVGAFITSREYVRWLAKAGHTVHVVTTSRHPGRPRTEQGGVRVWTLRDWRRAVQTARPELVISHHNDNRAAQLVPQIRQTPHLLMVHGMAKNRALRTPDLAWFPSQACRDHYPAHRGPALVLPPPIDPSMYRTRPGDLVTLNGSTAAKGADVVAQIAARMPETRFLVVRTPFQRKVPQPTNVTLVDRGDPRQVYARTRLLLMPSLKESYGRAGVEAMLSGIPVIAAPLPGMREAFGDAATYLPRDDVDGWAREIRRLSDPAAYADASTTALAHSDGLDYEGNLRQFEDACTHLARARLTPARGARPAPAAAPSQRVDVVSWVHFGVPYRRAGSETMLHTLMRALQDAGLDVLVVCSAMPEAPSSWTVDGVTYRSANAQTARTLIDTVQPRVVVSHHDFAERAIALSKTAGAKSVLLVHSDFDIAARALAGAPDLAVYNTRWVHESVSARYPQAATTRSLIVRPPVHPADHQARQVGDHVTLVNLNRDKGVDTWRQTAARLPRIPFLGVLGAHGRQVRHPTLRNMRIVRQTSDMPGQVWARTRLLMVPSVYESYGMAAVEALASGIPVLAHPTPGLAEALGDAATYIDRADTVAWTAAINELYPDGDRRAEATAAALARSAAVADQAGHEVKLWVHAVQDLTAT